VNFPESIEFDAEFQHSQKIKYAELHILYNKVRTCSRFEIMSTRIQPPDTAGDPYTWTSEMKKTGSIPPGTEVIFSRGIDDGGEETTRFPGESIDWGDSRFTWQMFEKDNLTIEWYSGRDGFGEALYDRVIADIVRLEIDAKITTPIKVLVYEDSTALRGAVLYTQEWVGGLAFTNQNIILIAINPENIDSQASGLTHEVAHLLVAQESQGCIGDMPTWLTEGLAVYAEGPVSNSNQALTDAAVASDSLITIRSLSSSFPADHSGATLSYAQSVSLVTYLIETQGWSKMQNLLKIFKSGSTYDGALTTAYGFDQAALDAAWRLWMASN
jgi:hypothetical protein